MLSKEELTKKAERMQAYLEIAPSTEPNELIERLNFIDIMIAQSGRMLADAKHFQETIINAAIMEVVKDEMTNTLSATVINQFVKSQAKDANYLVNWIDRINAAATHHKDSLRTIISFRKKEMEL